MNSTNGKLKKTKGRKHLRKLLERHNVKRVDVTAGDFFYIKMPRDSTHDQVDFALSELQRIFPENFVFVIPDDLDLGQLDDVELDRLGLMRKPKLVDDPTCPKCRLKNTMKEYTADKYRRICLEKSCGNAGGWRNRAELDEGGKLKEDPGPPGQRKI